MKLFFRQLGDGPPLIILHGLFGSSDNWHSLSKIFSEKFTVYVIDQRNHGQSPHSAIHNYQALSDDLNQFVEDHGVSNPIILGHSMGGKTAMNFAIKHPDKLSKLVIVDIAPKPYPVHHEDILKGLNAIDLKRLASRGEAEKILSEYVKEASVRQFLLKNLARDDQQQFEWRINIPVLEEHIEDMGAGLQYAGEFPGSTLFINGSKSDYLTKDDSQLILKYFPTAKIVTLDTGHWVQAEKPKEFTEEVLKFLN